MTTKLSNEEKRKQDTEEITKSFDAVIMPGKENQFKNGCISRMGSWL